MKSISMSKWNVHFHQRNDTLMQRTQRVTIPRRNITGSLKGPDEALTQCSKDFAGRRRALIRSVDCADKLIVPRDIVLQGIVTEP